MKNKNLLNRLWTDSHEKQSPQRFFRYAAMLIMLLTLGVGQMWAEILHVRGYGEWGDTDANLMTGSSSPWTFTANWASDCGFKIFSDNSTVGAGGWLATNSTLTLGSAIEINQGGDMHIPTWSAGIYTITVTKDNNKYYMTITAGSGGGGGGGSTETTFYFDNSVTSWSDVYLYLYSKNYWETNGSGSQSDKGCYASHMQMSLVEGSSTIYEYTYEGAEPAYVCFLNANQNNYGNFWNGEAGVVRGAYKQFTDNTKTLYTPTSSHDDRNNVYYYNSGSWSAYGPPSTVSYDGNGGTGTTASHTSVEYNTSVTLRANGFTRSGWEFDGWNTSQYGDGTSYAAGSSMTVTEDVTLYAQWKKVMYMRSTGLDWWYDSNAWFAVWVANADESKQNWVAMELADNCSSPAIYKATVPGNGYTKVAFVRKNPASMTLPTWDNKWNHTSKESMPTTNNQFTITGGSGDNCTGSWGTYSAPTYTISYAKGSPSASISGSKSDQSKSCDVAFTLPGVVFTRDGYTQTGWATSDGGGKAYNLGGSYTTNSAQTFYPYWEEKTYSLTFASDGHGTVKVGGSTVSSGSTASVNHFTTKTLQAIGDTGYDFDEWTLSGDNTSAVTIGSTTTASTTIKATGTGATVTANFVKHDYTIGYSPSPAVNFTYTTAPSTAQYGDQVDFTFTPAIGYRISTVTAVDASSNSVTVTNPSTNNYRITSMPASNITVTVTAILNTITVNYGAGSHGSLAAEQNSSSIGISGSTVVGGSTVNFTATPDDYYEVEGWYATYSDGVFSDKIDAAGTSTTYDVVANSTVNVFVKFKPTTYSITYNKNGGSGASNSSYTVESSQIILPTPTKSGCDFGGWYTNSGLTEGPVTSIPAGSHGNKEYWAKWSTSATLTLNSPSREVLLYTGVVLPISVTASNIADKSNVTFSYEYKVGSGSWNAITPKSTSVDGNNASCEWTTPSSSSNQEYYVRGKLTYTYNGVAKTVYTAQSSKISAIGSSSGSKTIKVKKSPAAWATLDGMYLWDSSIGSPGWPGYEIAVSYLGGKWYQLVIPEGCTNFILNNGVGDVAYGPDKHQTVNLTYSSSITNGGCYNLTDNSNYTDNNQKTYKYNLATTDCPSAPTVTTNTVSVKNLTSATMGGNITNDGNDDIIEYGYYYSTNSSLSSANAASVGTKVVVGTDNKSGSYSRSTGSLAIGTTYYVIAYAKNAHDTGWGSKVSFSTTAATLSLEGTVDYEANTMTITPTTNLLPANGFDGTYYICCTCSSKPGGASNPTITWNGSTNKLEITNAGTDGSYTFAVSLRNADNCGGAAYVSENITITQRTIPDRSGLTINHEKYNSTYMNGNGASETPYFVYLSNASSYGKLNLTATLPAALLTGETLYYSVEGAEMGTVTVDGTAASVTMDLPNKTVGADRTAAIKFYSKLDGQVAPSAKMASATVYYTVHADPVVTVTATYLGEEVESAIPQSATIVLSASVTNIPGESTFTYNKGDGDYSSTTSYTINEVGTTTMHAKTSYLGDWIGTKSITTYTANSVRFVILKTDMYGDKDSVVTSRLFKSDGESFTAPSVSGYTFSSWTCRGANVRVSDDDGDSWNTSSTEETVKVKATATGSALVANYDEVKRIYFDNSKAKWSGDIYVYLFSGDAWYNDYNSGNDNGPGVVPRLDGLLQACGQMTKIGESDIYYYEYTTPYAYVAFSIGDQHTYGHLYDTKGVWRTDFSSCNPCYVAPENSDQTKYDHGNNKPTYYYNNGYWRRYMPAYAPYSIYVTGSSPSRTLSGDQGKFTPENTSVDAENFVKDLLLDGGTTYWFNLPSSCGGSYGNNGEITKDNHTNFTFVSTSGGTVGNCRITTTAGGTYKFHLSTANGQIKLSVDYPLSEGDYRVLYSDNTGNNENTSNYIRKNTGEDAKDDIVSFFVKANAEPTFTIERCSGFEGNTPTWETAVAATGISVAKDSVYNFTFTQPAGGLTISKTAQGYYSGHYYIRTDGAAGGWANYLSNPDNIMKHTEKASAEAAGYNYYYLRWIGDANGNSTTNVKYCVATDYNDCVSQEFGNDPISGSLSGGQALTGKGANVRFTYHAGTNNMTRTYVGGSGHDNQYLVVNGTNLKKSDGTEWSGRTKMTDLNDWIYTFELKAKDGATISLESHYNDKYVTILPSETVLEVNNDDYYGLRIVYDYKTNEIVAAYIPSTVDDVLDVDVDIMFIRKALDNKPDAVAPTTTLTLTGSGKITGEPKTLYGAIEFEKDFVRAEGLYSGLSANRPERSTYWISFPFDVQVKDIFGLGEYTDTWILQRYRGDLRASKGWFLDTKTFWEYILDKDYVLQAGQGYVLSLDCEAIQWPHNQTTQYLYFPSKDKITDITSVLPSASMDVPEHICSITSPADRTIKDAHWNVIGVPGFNDAWGRATETVTVSGGDLRYFYTWDSETNTLSTTSARNYEFKFMHSYMVQYYGNIDWSASEPALAPARRSTNAKPEMVEFRIDIKQGDVKKDNTFVTLMDNDKITNGFDMNADLVKMYNANHANIYTLINDVEVSANCLPMTEQTTIVPVGVKIVANGDYTFSIPEGTEGIGVTLIDNETGIRTSLSALDYTIHLNAGTYNERFVLEISPVAQMPTDIENTDASVHDGIRKVMIDGILYIVRGNKIFDAQGKRVK